MKKEKAELPAKERSAEQMPAAESLERMKSFSERKEKFIAAVKKSKN